MEEIDDMEEMMLALTEGQIGILKNDEYVEAIATYVRSLYEKLIEKDFSEDAALQIITAIAPQSTRLAGQR